MVGTPGQLSRAVTSALKDAQLLPRDAATVALIRRYAALIDHAARLARQAEAAWEELDLEDMAGRQRLAKLAAQVEAQQVTSDLGPKLLAALTALGMTPAGRGAKGGGQGGAVANKLDEFTARRARKHTS